jgi:squalene-associated FAD-dependent desaturase
MPPKSVLVIGGGLAGLASAVALAEAGLSVRLLERRPHAGGRAASYLLPDGTHIDNCQHVTLGCCTNLADFYRRAGSADKIRFYDRLYFRDRLAHAATIEASPLPPPFHLAPSFALFSGLGLADKCAIARAMIAIVRSGGEPADAREITMLEWLRRHRQTPGAIERFWRVVLVSALDETLDRCAARYGVDVFWKAFLASRAGYRVGIPAVPLGELYAGCRQALERRGGEMRTRAGVREICVSGNCVGSVRLDDGSQLAADSYLAAVTHTALLEMLPAELIEREPVFAGLRRLTTSPITGVHLWFDRTVMHQPFLALLDLTVQWVFNKSRLSATAAGEASDESKGHSNSSLDGGLPAGGQYLQLVISASYDLVPRSRQEIIDLCRRDLAQVLPATREARLLKATVVKETGATISPAPGCDQWRPAQRSPVANLYLAGDWTQTGWPATMEGAVRSGYLAAEAILADAGQPARLLQPDLAVEGLARICARK